MMSVDLRYKPAKGILCLKLQTYKRFHTSNVKLQQGMKQLTEKEMLANFGTLVPLPEHIAKHR